MRSGTCLTKHFMDLASTSAPVKDLGKAWDDLMSCSFLSHHFFLDSVIKVRIYLFKSRTLEFF